MRLDRHEIGARFGALTARLATVWPAARAQLAAIGASLGPIGERFSPAWRAARETVRAAGEAARAWLADPDNLRRAGRVLLPVLVVAGLLLPPVSLVTRLRTLGYAQLRPGQDAAVPSDVGGVHFEVRRRAVQRASRVQLRSVARLPGEAAALPAGRRPITRAFWLDVRGPAPREAWLVAVVQGLTAGAQAFVDPYGWDGARWRWLDMHFEGENRVRVRLPLAEFVPEYVVITQVLESPTDVAAVLLPPPAAVPAAVAELPILEIDAYTIKTDDGHVAGQRFRVPSRQARVYGIVSNREGTRLRDDLVNNLLMQRPSRQRHREAIVGLVRRDELRGVVLDYRDIAGDLMPVYVDWLGRLAHDLHGLGAELFVAVPMPRRTADSWDSSPYNWRELAEKVDGVRVLLPGDAPLETERLDGMVRWALRSVERSRLQLAVPVQGRDIVDGVATPISYGEALGKILDMAGSDAPERISPGADATIELPTIRAAELGRDPATRMWRFYYWDANRRQHTVWLNDADGLRPAFDISREFFLSRLVLDGVEAGLDPALWRLTQAFIGREGEAAAAQASYRLRWQLEDADGQVVQQAVQPLETPAFAFRAPRAEGLYRLGVNLVTGDERLAAVGNTFGVKVAPPPPPTPTPRANVILLVPTPAPYVTAAAPADEDIGRAPVPVAGATRGTEPTEVPDAVVTFAEAQLRLEPDVAAGRVISELRVGDRLRVLGRTPDGLWLSVLVIATGVDGWVLADLVDLRIDAEAVPIRGEDGGTPTPTPGGARR